MTLVLRKKIMINVETEAGPVTVGLLSLLMIISLVPLLSRNCPNVLYYGLVVAFFISSADFYLNLDSGKKLTICIVVAYLSMLTLYKTLGVSSSGLSYYSTIVKYLFYPVAMMGLAGHLSDGQKKFLISLILIVVAVVLADNLRLYHLYGPSIYVEIFKKDRFTVNCINTPYVASLAFLGGTLFVCFLYEKRPVLKCASLVMSVLCLMFIVSIAQRAIILGMVLLLIPLLFMFSCRQLNSRVILVCGTVLIAALIIINIQQVLDIADNAISSVRLSSRIDQIRTYITSGDIEAAGGSLTGRYELTMRSIRTWTSSPFSFLFGAGDHRADNYTIGNHSFFFDELARYGLLGAMIWIPMLFALLRQLQICSDIEGNDRLIRLIHVIIFIYCFRSLIGSIMEATLGIQLFIFTPFVFSLLNKDQTI